MSTALQTQQPVGALASQASGRMAVADIISHVALVQEVMRAVMKQDVHYGIIPGTGDKPTLYKQGAEVLCMAFRVADAYVVEDLSTADTVRYRVTCKGIHQTTGVVLGSGMGEASSGEEKYKWRKAFDDEFNATPENLRRIKKGKYTTKQVRTDPADLANTVLKMANKRAKVAMTINVTACGDMFGQDLEDMDEALRDHLTRRGQDAQDAPGQPQARQPLPAYPQDSLDANLPKWREIVRSGKKTAADILAMVSTKATLTEAQIKAIKNLDVVDVPPSTPAEPAEPPMTAAEQAAHDDFISALGD
jgi:hypothetical protein